MVVNNALELGILTRNITHVLKSALMDLQWYAFKMQLSDHIRHIMSAEQTHPVGQAATSDPLDRHEI